jgi:hypothetical protein
VITDNPRVAASVQTLQAVPTEFQGNGFAKYRDEILWALCDAGFIEVAARVTVTQIGGPGKIVASVILSGQFESLTAEDRFDRLLSGYLPESWQSETGRNKRWLNYAYSCHDVRRTVRGDELLHELEHGTDGQSVFDELPPVILCVQQVEVCDEPEVAAPKQWLMSWHEIVLAIGEKHSTEFQRKVARLNKDLSGPIRTAKAGGQPMVERPLLIDWWNRLADIQQELANQENDRSASVQGTYLHGRQSGIVAPGIGGSVKQRKSLT